jgi:hypothetical protein
MNFSSGTVAELKGSELLSGTFALGTKLPFILLTSFHPEIGILVVYFHMIGSIFPSAES